MIFMETTLGGQFAVAKARNSQNAAWYWDRPWIERCSDVSETPQCRCWLLLRSFKPCDCLILLVVPATNAVSERSASALIRLKTYLRTTVTEEILNHCMYLNFQNFLGAHGPWPSSLLVPSAFIISAVAPILPIFPVLPHQGKNPAPPLAWC